MNFFMLSLSNEVLFKKTSVGATLQSKCALGVLDHSSTQHKKYQVTITISILYMKKYEWSQMYLQ